MDASGGAAAASCGSAGASGSPSAPVTPPSSETGSGGAAESGGSTEAERVARIEAAAGEILEAVGEDRGRQGLQETPLRFAKAMDFFTSGYRAAIDDVVNDAVFLNERQCGECDASDVVVVRDIDMFSLCEHHMVPFYGKIHIAYLPGAKILGLSKFARVTDVYARRLQVQERITQQVADALTAILEPRGLMVIVEATHLCMCMRGVEKCGASTVTTAARGAYAESPALRQEFVALSKS